MKNLVCGLFGHKAGGPVVSNIKDPVLYYCIRCHQLIYFDRGWKVWQNIGN